MDKHQDKRKDVILIVDDEAEILRSLRGMLEDEGFAVLTESSAEAGLRSLRQNNVNLAIVDVFLPGMSGLEFLKTVGPEFPELPAIVMTGQGSYETAFTALKLGAYDFFEKPLAPERLIVSIRNALEAARIRAHRDELLRAEREDFTMIGESEPMQRLGQELRKVAASESKVLVTGENGSGKELVARAIHELSARRDFPFVKINCAAIPKDLVESELFGFEKGAFTGAMQSKKGKLELADGGTLFMDEVADMSLEAQAKFLRAAEFAEFERVGGTKTIKFDVRIIAATNRDLKEEIRRGSFREDLYHRLNVLMLEVPALRERGNDVLLLAQHFLRKSSLENTKEEKKLAPDALELLKEYPWPGNVRQLKNLMERIVIMSDQSLITREEFLARCPDLTENLGRNASARTHPASPAAPRASGSLADLHAAGEQRDLRASLATAEEQAIRSALKRTSWNVSEAARTLGIDRVTLHKKMKRLGIEKRIADD
ncbi:MAG: sigma-54 dependent transcriptional regulator [Candidatus Eisenbacteria bacterium]|nr:sigma-54 dependent transcriptional regulator [Candidatus Eisenbacteria bacterium]